MLHSQFSTLLQRLKRSPWQLLAFAACFLFGVLMVINVQLAGDAEWFFYAQLVHKGVRLYADLHLPLQPFFVLETDAWMLLFGKTVLGYELISLFHLFLFCLAVLLILRRSPWSDGRKAILFLAIFFVNFFFVGVRFDDFHVVCDICALYSILALLRLNEEGRPARELWWAVAAGILSGISFTTRSTEGAMLLLGTAACILFLAPKRKLLSTAMFLIVSCVIILGIIHLTGDTLHDYAANSIFHAAASKGGTNYVFLSPIRACIYTFASLWHNKGVLWSVILLATGFLTRKFWKDTPAAIIGVELLAIVPVLVMLFLVHSVRKDLTNGAFIVSLNIIAQNAVYPLCLYVLFRFLRSRGSSSKAERPAWNPVEILIFLVVTNLIAVAASQGIGTYNGTFAVVMFLLFAHLWLPAGARFRWVSDTWIAIAIVLFVAGAVDKVRTPYGWASYGAKPMFEGRQWYRHPLYGPMYIESDTLHFFQPVCDDIHRTDPHPELLSMPYSYANYFCGIPPWDNYVQTWFDTTEPDTVRKLVDQLNQSPPEWILYQRQLAVLHYHEIDYNGGNEIPHRALDKLIMAKIASGQWKLVEYSNYLVTQDSTPGDGWYLVQTHP